MKPFFKTLIAAGLLASASASLAAAQEVTLRFHSFLPAGSYPHAKFFTPWCEKIREESGGRMACQVFPSMQLGGSPADLINQTRDGIVDIAYGNPGYSPGSYLAAEVFELPFMLRDLHDGARGMWDYFQGDTGPEFDGVRLLAIAPADFPIIMTADKHVEKLEDMQGLSLRSAGRYGGLVLKALGALPVQMPAGEISESLNRGVIQGIYLPWSAISLLKLDGPIQHYTEFADHQERMYTSIQTLTMSQATYDRLPPDLQKVIDDNSGAETSAWFADAFASTAGGEREAIIAKGRDVTTLSDEEYKRWRAASENITELWLADARAKGLDADGLLAAAKAAIAARSK